MLPELTAARIATLYMGINWLNYWLKMESELRKSLDWLDFVDTELEQFLRSEDSKQISWV